MGTSSSKCTQTSELENSVIAAIDFGTVNTGLAIRVPEDNSIISRVFEENDRVPSVVLLDGDKTVKSFGRKAHNQFCSLTKEQQFAWYFFQNYKLQFIRAEHVNGHSDVSSMCRTSINALQLLQKIIKHLQDLVYQRLCEASTKSTRDRPVQWIITVPAIMSPYKREFVRKAAENAGIPSNRLRLVLEPEAAAFSALQNLLKDKSTGFRYILADLGGGTVDICAHEILKNGKIREIFPRQGKICGGHLVNENYEIFLSALVGDIVWKMFLQAHPDVYMDMLAKFEEQKKDFSVETHMVSIRIEAALLNTFEKIQNSPTTLEELIKKSEYNSFLRYDNVRNNLSLHGELMKQFFKETLDVIIQAIENVQNECSIKNKDAQTLILSGGLSESPYIRRKLEEKFAPKMCLLREIDPRNTVVRGAILIGKADKNVIERLADYTYGFASTIAFNPSAHTEEASCMVGEKRVCKLFNTIIKKGEAIDHKKCFSKQSSMYTCVDLSTDDLITEFYRSNDSIPKFCHNCEHLVTVIMKKPEQGWQKPLKLQYEVTVEDIELYIRVKNLNTNLYESTRYLDCLQ